MYEDMNNNGFIDDDDSIMFTERKRWVFFALPFTFTKYTITPTLVTVNQGFLSTTENDCYMYKIQDVKLTTSFFERIFGLSTITCYTGDITTPELVITHVKHAKEIKSYLLKASEEARLKRRTMHMQDISAHSVDDVDDLLDNM